MGGRKADGEQAQAVGGNYPMFPGRSACRTRG